MKQVSALLSAVAMTVFAGCATVDGTPSVTPLAVRSDPGPITGIALAPDGSIYAAGGLDQPLQKLSRDGNIEKAWGKGLIASKHGLRRCGSHLYATDIDNHQVFQMDLDGNVQMTLGERGVPGCDATHFDKPTDVAVAPNGDLYITDGYGNSRVACFGADGKFKFDWGKRGDAPGEFFHPHNIVIGPDRRIYVADRDNRRIQVFTMEGKFLEARPESGSVFGLDLDPAGGRLFYTVNRPDWHGVVITALDGTPLCEIGGKGSGPGQFDVPHSLVYDAENRSLFVGEVANRRIQKISLHD